MNRWIPVVKFYEYPPTLASFVTSLAPYDVSSSYVPLWSTDGKDGEEGKEDFSRVWEASGLRLMPYHVCRQPIRVVVEWEANT